MEETGDGVENSDEKENDWMNKWKGEERKKKEKKGIESSCPSLPADSQ